MAFYIRSMTDIDFPAVAEIYQEGMLTGSATFAEHPPATWEEWTTGKINGCSLLACEGVDIIGWAALNSVSTRSVYTGVGEVSIYVRSRHFGKGVGSFLLNALVEKSEAKHIWTLQAGIFPENHPSLNLHFRHGFRLVGVREKLGKMTYGPFEGCWRDVFLLERRSKIIW